MTPMREKQTRPWWREASGCFYATYYDENGHRKRPKLDPDYDKSVIMLDQLRKDVERVRLRVVTRAELTVAAGGDLDVLVLLGQFCDELKGARRSAGYVREVRQTVQRYVKFAKLRTAKQVSTASIERWLSGLLSNGRSTETRNKAATRLRTFFGWVVERQHLAANPAKGIKRVRGDGGVDSPRALTEAELSMLLSTVGDKRRRLAYLLMSRAGLRVREAHRVMPHHLDIDGGWIRLDRAITKEGRDADLPMHDAIRDELRAMTLGAVPVCGPTPSRYTWLRDLERAGIVKHKDPKRLSGNWDTADLIGYRDDRGRVLSRRCLRHTYGTMLAAAGVFPQVACKLMRHANPEITMKFYTDARLLDLRGAVDKLDTKPPAKERTA